MDGVIDQEADHEFEAIQTIIKALKPLEEEARERVLEYVVARLGLKPSRGSVRPNGRGESSDASETDDAEAAPDNEYEHLAELFDAAQPQTDKDKALVAGYWLQVCKGSETLEGQRINTELKHLGEGLTNITRAIDQLMHSKPALVIQLRKSGKTRQARKTYKITHAGKQHVEGMISD